MRHRTPAFLICAGLATGAAMLGLRSHGLLAQATPLPALPQVSPLADEAPRVVIGPGRIEPDGGVIRIGAPIDLGASVVAQLLVAEGDRVARGQVLAILESHDAAAAALHVAERHRDGARARLAEAKAGQAEALIGVKRAALAAARIKLEFARRQLARSEPLLAAGDVAAEKNDQSALEVASDTALVAQAESDEAEAEAAYNSGVVLASADLAEAEAAVEQARANLERTVLRAPRTAQVLRVITRAGEQIGMDGVLEIGDTRQRYAVADIYAPDAAMLRIGQSATISGRGLAEPQPGTVTAIGLMIRPRRMAGVDPEDARGGRVVEVWVRLDNASPAIIGSEVRVAIRVAPSQIATSRICGACSTPTFDVGAR